MKVSKAFECFADEAPIYQSALMEMVQKLSKATSLDEKTSHLSYLAVLAAVRLESGIPFHVQLAKKCGATREEIIGAILVGLPAVGNVVVQSLPVALDAYDES